MKVRMKVESTWLQLERKSMEKMKKDYETWESETLKRAKDAKNLRSLREVFYQLGDRWEWNQATGAWLESGQPLDTVGFILRMPGFHPCKERYVVYGVMAYSKGLTDQFDHLGDKERIIIERDTDSGKMVCWSTTGHGAMDLVPIDVSAFESIEDILQNCYLVAQPGDHALRLEIPRERVSKFDIAQRMWTISSGGIDYSSKDIDVLSAKDIEDRLDFRFYRYAQSVIEVDRVWSELSGGAIERAKEKVLDKIPDHIENKMKDALRRVEGLLHILWFKPPMTGLEPARKLYDDMKSEPIPTDIEKTILPYLGELVYALNDIIEKAKYIKWKSVMDKKSFGESDAFEGLDLSNMAKEAFAVALEDVLQEHTLAYVGYPERGTMVDKAMRIVFGIAVLPMRLVSTFVKSARTYVRIPERFRRKKEAEPSSDTTKKDPQDLEENT
ncbi:MAG: hypothetical protein P1Q69_13630 [Candidatus Thorarchaeota archaeon]|nr:hypothetical protein [Candidatus Thorarchaeota archaeon]